MTAMRRLRQLDLPVVTCADTAIRENQGSALACAVLRRTRMRYSSNFAIALFATAVVGCGPSPTNLTLKPLGDLGPRNRISLVVTNAGGRATAPLTVGLSGDPAFAVTSDSCSGVSLAPQQMCVFVVGAAGGTHSATATVDDGHGAHATYPVSFKFSDAPITAAAAGPVDVDEGQGAMSNVTVTNIGDKPTGYLSINLFIATRTNDQCTGMKLAPNESCTFTVLYTAPLGSNAPVRFPGSVDGDPGESASFEADFNVIGQLKATSPSFGSNAAAGATTSVAVSTKGQTIGPLNVSIDGGSGTPPVTFPPFLIVSAQNDCNGQTLTLSSYTCNVSIELDPRLPAGGSYRATLTVGAGGETLSVPVSAMLAP